MTEVVTQVSDLLFGKPKIPALPAPEVPATPAPNRREDTGANIVIGSDNAKNKRASGGGSGRSSASPIRQRDVLGGLGRGGLNI